MKQSTHPNDQAQEIDWKLFYNCFFVDDGWIDVFDGVNGPWSFPAGADSYEATSPD